MCVCVCVCVLMSCVFYVCAMRFRLLLCVLKPKTCRHSTDDFGGGGGRGQYIQLGAFRQARRRTCVCRMTEIRASTLEDIEILPQHTSGSHTDGGADTLKRAHNKRLLPSTTKARIQLSHRACWFERCRRRRRRRRCRHRWTSSLLSCTSFQSLSVRRVLEVHWCLIVWFKLFGCYDLGVFVYRHFCPTEMSTHFKFM